MSEVAPWSDDDVAAAVSSVALWYHTIDLRPGIVTPGWFDLRPIVDKIPWPDVRGKRCLDVGTYDGFLAFQLESRGAGEVVATDISNHEDWDWPVPVRMRGLEYLRAVAGEKGSGFALAHRALGSSVVKREINIYDLHPDIVGTFDVVVCGSLLLHLRDPIRALEALRSVCAGVFLSCEEIDLPLTLAHRRRPLTRFGPIERGQWHIPNVAGHRAMVTSAGFNIERTSRPYSIPLGVSHPPVGRTPRGLAERALRRTFTNSDGVPHAALVARPM